MTSGSETPIHHDTLWFEDGNVVLQSENTVFKVFKGILRKQSAVFADILALPPSTAPEDLYDECPLIKMEESVGDLTVFLSAIFDPGYLDNAHDKLAMPVLLRTATKYDAETLRCRAIITLRREFPDNFEAFLAKEVQSWQRVNVYQPFFRICIDWEFHAAVLREARKCGVPELLPTAFFEAMSQPLPDIFSTPYLDAEDRSMIIAHRDAVAELGRKATLAAIPTSRNCDCVIESWRGFFQSLNLYQTFQDPFQPYDRHSFPYSACSHCRDAFMDLLGRERCDVWSALPKAENAWSAGEGSRLICNIVRNLGLHI